MKFRGSIPALITPMRGGAIDEAAYRKLIEWQISEGSHGIVPVGTTGESPTVSSEEHKRLVEIAVETAAGRVPVIAGTGSNSTDEAIDYTRHAEKVGADAALVVVPYYNKPTQEGLYQHFRAIASAVDIPIFIYNVPGRTIANISLETVDRLARDCRNIVGIKDATADLTRPSRQRGLTGDGFIVAPRLCAKFQEATLRGDYAEAILIQDRLMPLHTALFCETSPSPVKYAASLLGLSSDEVRLPLVPATEAARKQVKDAMVHAGLLN